MVFTHRKIKKKSWGWGHGRKKTRSLHLGLCGLGKRGRMLNVGAWKTGGTWELGWS